MVTQHDTNDVYPNMEIENCYKYDNYFLDYFNHRALKLFRIDHIRLIRLLEISYYTIIFSMITLLLGTWINSWFSRADKEKSTGRLIGEIIPNMLVLGILIFYINKIVLLFPFPLGQLFLGNMYYCPGNQKQIGISTIVGQGLVLFSSQVRLQGKIRIIALRWDGDDST